MWLGRLSRRGERGQSTVETAMVMILIITMIFGVFEVCELMYVWSVMADAAHEGVRYAVVHHGVVANDANVIAVTRRFAGMSMHDVSAITINVSLPDGNASPPHLVRVTVAYSYVPYLHRFMPNPPTIHTYAEGRMIVN